MKRKKVALGLKIELTPGAKLSAHFVNRRDCYKVVETDNVFSYVVSRDGPGSVATICPVYSASVYVKVGDAWHVVSSYEQGDRLNGYTFYADYQGCTLATIAAQAVAALNERKPPVQQTVKQTGSVKRGRRG